jgi:hypothetical protein
MIEIPWDKNPYDSLTLQMLLQKNLLSYIINSNSLRCDRIFADGTLNLLFFVIQYYRKMLHHNQIIMNTKGFFLHTYQQLHTFPL